MDEMSKVEFAEIEKDILGTMFGNMLDVIEICDGYLSIRGKTFDRNDLYELACKIGIEDY